MKKLLFSLVAAAACGAVTAAPATATFESATFDLKVPDSDGRYYWEIDTSTEPELTAKGEGDTALGYLQINTGSTPLWRTFSGVDNPTDVEDAELDAAGVDTNGVVVSSDVKLTACTEWPTLTDFANEKLALFLFAKEEGDTSGKDDGLYAVGGAMVDPDGEGEAVATLTRTAYKLTVTGDITNNQGWATISIKTYGDIYKTSGADKLAGFVIAVNGKIATRAEATGFTADDLGTTAATRNTDGTLIPAAMTTTAATITGLGFQGEGGIDNVNLAAADFAVDAVTMTANVSDDVVANFTGATYADGALTFTIGKPITFTVSSALDIVTVMYNDEALEPVEGVYTIATPATTDELVISASAAAFQIGDGENAKKYATLADALKDLKSGDTLKLLGNAALDETLVFAQNATLDLAGKTITASEDFERGALVKVNGAYTLTIIDSVGNGAITPDSGNAVDVDTGVLVVNAGTFDGAIALSNNGTATINGGKFAVKVEAATIPGDKQWSDLTEGYYTLKDKVVEPDPEPTPSLPEDDQSGTEIEKVGNDYVVTPGTGVTEVTVNTNGFAGMIEIPSTVEKIIGVAKEQLRVVVSVTGDDSVTKTYNITEAIKLAVDGTISLDDTKTVTVEVTVGDKTVSEQISVKPELADTAADGETEVAPFEAGATPAATIKTIPGLTYSLDFDSDVKGAFGTSAASKTADGNRMTLRDENTSGATKRFYKIRVRK